MSTDWVPGDPLMPDNGCGGGTTLWMNDAERTDALATDTGNPPPWWRPEPETRVGASSRYCNPCGVRWSGDEVCWVCGGLDEVASA